MSDIHHPATERIEEFAAGTLDSGDRAVIESHLSGCATCRLHVGEWRALFAALSDLPRLEPSSGFADGVMARVQVAPAVAEQPNPVVAEARAAWAALRHQWLRPARALAARAVPKTAWGWSLAAALLALPVILGGGLILRLMAESSLTVGELRLYATDWLGSAVRGFGSAAVAAIMQTEFAASLATRAGAVLATAGARGIGVLAAATGFTTMLCVWILYRYLFRTPTRESHHGSFCF